MINPCSTKLSSSLRWDSLRLLPLVWGQFILVTIFQARPTQTKRLYLVKFFVISILIFCSLKASIADAFVVSPHEIFTDTTWSKVEGPYLVPWPLTIHAGATLSIEPGTVVALQGAPIYVEGALRVGDDASESVVFESTLESGIISPEADPPNDTAYLQLVVETGQIDVSNVEIRGHLSLRTRNGRVKINALSASSSDMYFDGYSQATATVMFLDQTDFIVVSNNSSLSLQGSTIHDGYINIDTQSSLSLQYTELFDIEKIRILNQSSCVVESVYISGGGGFLIKNKSTAAIGNSVVENIFADSVFSVSNQSRINFTDSAVSPLFSNFVLLVDGSTLAATSTDVTNMLQKGIQAVRDVSVHLYDVTIAHTLATGSFDTFLVSLVGSTLVASKSSFLSTSGNALELYNSNTKPYSTISINDSTIKDYGQSGVYAVQATGTIEHTSIRNGRKGIEHIFSHLNVVQSYISDNSEYGAVAYVPSYTLLAQDNFWGDSSGPHHEAIASSGKGDTVSDNVLFAPWLSKDPLNPCCSSVLFLPGLMASRLYASNTDAKEEKLWEPSTLGGGRISELHLDDMGQSMRGDIYTRDVIDETPLPLLGVNIYKSFTQDMSEIKDSSRIQDWVTIPYDWRLSIYNLLDKGLNEEGNIFYSQPTTSPYILQEFKRLARESKTGRVTIVAHSNGGLVAKALAVKLKVLGIDTLIDKVILVAVPQIGTPQAVGALLHGFGQGIPKDSFPFLASPKRMQTFGFNMPGAYGLLPSFSYFAAVGDPLITFDTSLIATFPNFLYFLRGLNPHLLSYSQYLHEEIDVWMPPPHIQVVQIGGWGRDTVKGIWYYQGVKNKKPITQYEPLFTENGDQTVVIPSALFIATSTSNISRYWINLKQANKGSFIKKSHADILELSEMRNLIQKVVLSEPVASMDTIATSSPVFAVDKKVQILLHSEAAELDMYDAEGNHTGISTTTGLIEEGIPNSSYGRLGNVVYIRVSDDGAYVPVSKKAYVTTRAPTTQEDSYTIDVTQIEDNGVATTTSFVDVSVTGTTTASFSVPKLSDETPVLEMDVNNDGLMDYQIKHHENDVPVIPAREARSPQGGTRRHTISTSTIKVIQRLEVAGTGGNFTGRYFQFTPSTSQKNGGVILTNQTASVFNALSHDKMLRVSSFSSNYKHMKKILGVIIAIGILGGIGFVYVARPVSAPTQDINTAVSAKLPADSATSSMYRISQEKSLVKFTMNEMLNGSPFLVVGTTTQVAGDIAIKDGKFQIGELAINAKTLVTDSSSRNAAIARFILKSETPGNEFITFKPTSNNLSGSVEVGKIVYFNLSGDLTISGVTKPVTFTTSAVVSNTQIVGTAETTIKRSDFNLKIPNLSFIANVDDAFPVTISIVADRIMQ